ncbi:ribonuclease HII [Corynebacterium timonense]|uniref:Ribonuclease HII n=1 Tax=Corynebacterium timonense TaxID=441500 RepID=A0A1H1N0N4_9CORY|nr:ribonuclease HII [Corynebacterium timonense]SDR91739.1 RNase HII [Corynebacterium timonense]
MRAFEEALQGSGLGPVAGVDEAGRGACFGPVTVAACVLPPQPVDALAGLRDSKKLTPKRRAELFEAITDTALAYSVVHVPAAVIDRRGIQAANLDGARRAVATLAQAPGYVLVDAFRVPGVTAPQLPIVGGDNAARCVAAASVLAKVSRDRLVTRMAERYPEYGVEGHKGYSTAAHMDAVRRHGASAEHRYSYANVRTAHEHFERSQ